MKHLTTPPSSLQAKVFALLLASQACAIPSKSQDIIGGSPIDIIQAPWQVSLELNGGIHDCGGIILNGLWILTAAHCLDNNPIIVHAGATDQTNNSIGQRIQIAHKIKHLNYVPASSTNPATNDMALLRLAQPLCFNERVQPISFATLENTSEADVAVGTPVFVTGWGDTGNGCCSAILMGATIPVIGRTEASLMLNDPLFNICNIDIPNSVTDAMLLLYAPEVAVGGGDSGGPAVINANSGHPMLVGVSSWGGCPRDGFPSVEANVRVLANFITSNITPSVPPCTCPDADIHIWENTVYDQDTDMPSDIIVHSKAELTIQAKIGMRQGKKILVGRNARLVVGTGGVLTRGCGAPDWAGVQVLGNNKNPQPTHDAALNMPSQAGIVSLDNCKIEWAETGVWAGDNLSANNGGVVWAKGTTGKVIFRNNRRGMVFAPYAPTGGSKNKSRLSNVTFEEVGNAFADTEGVKIEGTDGIEFENCTFINLDFERIRNADAPIKVVNDNTFEANETGISSFATFPMSLLNPIVIGADNAGENTFTGNQYHINASLATGFFEPYSNGLFALNVINNNFTGGEYGVLVTGPSNFTVAGNLLTGVGSNSLTAVGTGGGFVNTGYNNLNNQNFVGCNRFQNGAGFGMLVVGDNKQMQFLANEFEMNAGALDVALVPQIFNNAPARGAVRATQGAIGAPAENCFSDPGTQFDIYTWGLASTDHFTYFYQAGEPPALCEPEPLNPGIYSKTDTPKQGAGVPCDMYGGLPEGMPNPTPGDLDTRRATLQQLSPFIATDTAARDAYYRTLQEKDAILRYLVGQALANAQFATAEGFLAGEQSKAADWAIFGLRMRQQDYANAALWLNQLPVQNDEDAAFRDIQTINIQRLQQPDSFLLSASQEAYLTQVAESGSPVREYARGILGVLKDRRFYPDPIQPIEPRNRPAVEGTDSQDQALRVFPVPATSMLSVSWPLFSEGADAHLTVCDIFGKPLMKKQVQLRQNQHTLEVGQLPVGVYFLILSDKGKAIHRTKFTVQH